MKKVRAIAFYLPQFYPIPENDEWWGKGFTEWTNVKKATPLFEGHHQPNVPGELGFYDLRNPEVREQQAALAKEYGIEGFCYWHYWFGNEKRILERVFDEVLDSGKPDFPFCLAWANETWTGIWHGAKDRVLIEQTYPGKKDYKAHFHYLLRAFKDKRYIKVNGKPIFVVYRPHEIKDIQEFVSVFREQASVQKLEGIYLVGNNAPEEWNPLQHGFDAVAPVRLDSILSAKDKFLNKINNGLKKTLSVSLEDVLEKGPFTYEYKKAIEKILDYGKKPYRHFPNVLPNWDNTPRSGKRGWILKNSSPELFGEFLRKAIKKVEDYPDQEKIIFIKSWNEWAEGNYLEPDLIHGRKYLQACKKEIYFSNQIPYNF